MQNAPECRTRSRRGVSGMEKLARIARLLQTPR